MPAGAHEKLTHSEEAVLSAQVDDDSSLQEEACGLFWTLRPSTVEPEKHIWKRRTVPSWWFLPSPIQTIFEVYATGQTRPKRTAHVSPHLHTASTGRTADNDMERRLRALRSQTQLAVS